jgi:hypothetical protein
MVVVLCAALVASRRSVKTVPDTQGYFLTETELLKTLCSVPWKKNYNKYYIRHSQSLGVVPLFVTYRMVLLHSNNLLGYTQYYVGNCSLSKVWHFKSWLYSLYNIIGNNWISIIIRVTTAIYSGLPWWSSGWCTSSIQKVQGINLPTLPLKEINICQYNNNQSPEKKV